MVHLNIENHSQKINVISLDGHYNLINSILIWYHGPEVMISSFAGLLISVNLIFLLLINSASRTYSDISSADAKEDTQKAINYFHPNCYPWAQIEK